MPVDYAKAQLVDRLLARGISHTQAEQVAAVVPNYSDSLFEALALLGRSADGTVATSLRDLKEYFSEESQRYYYAINGETSWDPPPCFAFSEWQIDADMYCLPLLAVRELYLSLDRLLAQHPPAVAFSTLNLIAKLLGNVADCQNSLEKFRSVRLTNPRIKAGVVEVSGALEVLLFAGFLRSGGEMLVLPVDAQLGPLRAAAARARNLAQHKGHSGSAVSVVPDGRRSGGCNSVRPPSKFYGKPGFKYQEKIYHCGACDHPINDGSERLWTRSHEAPRGEFRFECETCLDRGKLFNLCQVCWDRQQQGSAQIHPSGHSFQHVGPRMTRHNDYYSSGGNGDVNAGNPWGNISTGSGYRRGLARLRERYGLRSFG